MLKLAVIALVLSGCGAIHLTFKRHCDVEVPKSGLSDHYSENIAHAIHSMTVQGLKLFNPKATEKNSIPTVNHNVSAPNKVIPFAPDDPWGSEFGTDTMNMIDKILSNVGMDNDGLGEFWSPVERVVHNFHMWDLWIRIQGVYRDMLLHNNVPDQATCACLNKVQDNGIRGSVEWVANHYKAGTPITLLGRPIPKLTDAATWKVWKERLLYYYTETAFKDAAKYLYCASF